jgi:hypothetical protein
MTKVKRHANGTGLREEWLQRAVTGFAMEWSKLGVVVPNDVRVSCSFPAGGNPTKRVGECCPRSRSMAKVNEVFINPILEVPLMVLNVLGHELIHAADDCEHKHGKVFTMLSKRVGYSGGKNSAAKSDEALLFLAKLAGELGPYPHREVLIVKKPQKENTGLHKFECAVGVKESEDGEEAAKPDVLYSTAKMVELYGIPLCRCHGEQMFPVDRQKKNEITTV